MSIAVNKHGNMYEKTNTGKIAGTVVGAGACAGIAYANLDGIKKRCSSILKDIDKDILQLKIGIGCDKKDIEF